MWLGVGVSAGWERWLLEGDPAVRRRVLRDLGGGSAAEVARERARVAEEGWGARLLSARWSDWTIWCGCCSTSGRRTAAGTVPPR
jgi:hypothetical protein